MPAERESWVRRSVPLSLPSSCCGWWGLGAPMAVGPVSDGSQHRSPEPPPEPRRGQENPGVFPGCEPSSICFLQGARDFPVLRVVGSLGTAVRSRRRGGLGAVCGSREAVVSRVWWWWFCSACAGSVPGAWGAPVTPSLCVPQAVGRVDTDTKEALSCLDPPFLAHDPSWSPGEMCRLQQEFEVFRLGRYPQHQSCCFHVLWGSSEGRSSL